MQLACPYGVSLPQAEQLFDTAWRPKLRTNGFFTFLFVSSLSPRSGVRVSRDDPSRLWGVAACTCLSR